MLIRIKFEGKSRRLSEKVQTVADLKSKIRELYGNSAASLQIVYKDCDSEEVTVIDDEDLKNCYNEANDLKQTSLTFIVKSKKLASRSQSREGRSRSPGNRFHGSSNHHYPGQRGQTTSDMSEKSKKRGKTPDAKRGAISSGEEITSSLKHLQKECSRVGVTDPISFLGDIFISLEGECPGLAYNPLLVASIMDAVKVDLQAALKKSYTGLVSKKPELVEKNKEFRDRLKSSTEEKPAESEREGYQRREIGKGPSKMERDEVSDRRGGNKESREREPEYRQPYTRHAQSKNRNDYDSRPIQSNNEYRGGRYERDNRDEDFSKNAHYESDEVLRKLCYAFPNKSKSELRAIISQNPGKPTNQLEDLIMQSRKARSHRY